MISRTSAANQLSISDPWSCQDGQDSPRCGGSGSQSMPRSPDYYSVPFHLLFLLSSLPVGSCFRARSESHSCFGAPRNNRWEQADICLYIVPSVRRLGPEQILSQGAVCPASQLLPFGECPLSGVRGCPICSLLNPKLLPSAHDSMVELSYP